MSSLAAIRLSNASKSPSYSSTAVFIGGTSGIGRAMAETFSKHNEGNSTIVIVGRNRSAAEEVMSTFPSTVKSEFIECDATAMKNVKIAASKILENHPKINYLVMSTGFMTMDGFTPTEDGIDRKLAVHYYSRWRFTESLIPALEKANEAGEESKIMSVLGAGKGSEIDVNDLGLKKTYSTTNAALSAPTYNDLMMEEFSSRHPRLTFVHAYPGFVRTPIAAASSSKIISLAGPLLMGLSYPFTVSPEACAQYMWHGLYNLKEGVYRTGSLGEDLGKKRYFGNDDQRRRLWEHTWKATRVEGESTS